jgi:ComF family protein
MKRMLNGVADLIYPRECGGCGCSMADDEGALCWDCLASCAPVTRPFCERCGDPIEGVSVDGFRCSLCRRRPPAFTMARSAFRYRGKLKHAMHGFKYSARLDLADNLAQMLESCVRAHGFDRNIDVILPVPLHATRFRERGYNQSSLLAKHLARRLGLYYRPAGILSRVRDTATQTGLNARQRAVNVQGAFKVTDSARVRGQSVLLVDDVMTTGATVSAAAKALHSAGAAGVYVVTVARG